MEKTDHNYPSPRTSPVIPRYSSMADSATTSAAGMRKERASGANEKERVRAPLGPPVDPQRFESDEEWRDYHNKEKVDHWHHLPLMLVALPPLGAIIHGRAENWTDAMILILVCFYLYHLVRVPWDLYYASRSRRILSPSVEATGEDEVDSFERKAASHSLQQSELISLAMTVVAPVVGSYFLFLARGMLSDPDRYINKFTISLFGLATAVKPLLHLAELFRKRALFYQEVVHYPSTQVHLLQRKLDKLESDLSQLSKAFATKQDVRLLRDGVDVPLTQLSKAVRRYERKEEYARLSAEERFALLDSRLEQATNQVYLNSQVVEKLKADYDSSSHPVTTIIRVLNHMLGQRFDGPPGAYRSQRALHWWNSGPFFYIFLPLNVSSMAVGWATNKAVEAVPNPPGVIGLKK